MNTPATPLYATGTKDAATEPPAQVSEVPPGRDGAAERRTGPPAASGGGVRVKDLRHGMSVVVDGVAWMVTWLGPCKRVWTLVLTSQGGAKRQVHLHSGRRLPLARRAVRPYQRADT